MSLKRLARLKPYTALPSSLRSLAKLMLLHGIPGEEACATLEIKNPARTLASPKLVACLEAYKAAGEGTSGTVWDEVRRLEIAANGKSSLPLDTSNLSEADADSIEALMTLSAIGPEKAQITAPLESATCDTPSLRGSLMGGREVVGDPLDTPSAPEVPKGKILINGVLCDVAPPAPRPQQIPAPVTDVERLIQANAVGFVSTGETSTWSQADGFRRVDSSTGEVEANPKPLWMQRAEREGRYL